MYSPQFSLFCLSSWYLILEEMCDTSRRSFLSRVATVGCLGKFWRTFCVASDVGRHWSRLNISRVDLAELGMLYSNAVSAWYGAAQQKKNVQGQGFSGGKRASSRLVSHEQSKAERGHAWQIALTYLVFCLNLQRRPRREKYTV